MQYNTPPQRRTRSDTATPIARRPGRDYAPRKRKNKALSVVPLLVLFVIALAAMYVIFPKEAGRHVGASRYDGLVISEVMAANNSAVPDENGEFSDWLELYNGTGADLDLLAWMVPEDGPNLSLPKLYAQGRGEGDCVCLRQLSAGSGSALPRQVQDFVCR